MRAQPRLKSEIDDLLVVGRKRPELTYV